MPSPLKKRGLILRTWTKNIFHAGPAGAGQVAKGCNNMLLAIHMIGTCEALEMGARNGLDPKVLSEIMLGQLGPQLVAGSVQPLSEGDADSACEQRL